MPKRNRRRHINNNSSSQRDAPTTPQHAENNNISRPQTLQSSLISTLDEFPPLPTPILPILENNAQQVQNQTVLKKEEQESDLIPKQDDQESILFEFAKKPNFGSLGKQIALEANHFKIEINHPFSVYHYDVSLKAKQTISEDKEIKEVKAKYIMREMFKVFLNNLTADYQNKIVYDFSKNLYSLIKLPFEGSILYEIPLENKKFVLELKEINQIRFDPNKYNDPIFINVLNLVFTHNLNYNHVVLKRSFFEPGTDSKPISKNLQLWRGTFSSVKPSESYLTCNIDSTNGVFYPSKNLLKLAIEHYNCKNNELNNRIDKDKIDGLIGASFIEKFNKLQIKYGKNFFRKNIVSFGPNSFHEFEINDKTKTKISIKDYFEKRYSYNVKYPNLYCIHVGNKSYLPLEICETVIKNETNLSKEENQERVKQATCKNFDRLGYIKKWVESNAENDPILKQYNIIIDKNPIKLDGRLIEAPQLNTKDKALISSQTIGTHGKWPNKNKFFNTVKIKNSILLDFVIKDKYNREINNFLNKLIEIGKTHDILFEKAFEIKHVTDEHLKLENFCQEFQTYDLILVIFDQKTHIYNKIKTLGDLDYGVPTQCIEKYNFKKLNNYKNDNIISNIFLKINTKLGGTNHILSKENELFSKYIKQFYEPSLMIFGADVTHPSPGNKVESIAAVVGSLDKDCCYYAARLYAQIAPGKKAYEMIHNLEDMFLSLLNEYYNKNKEYPQKIVFYRDGVSEGQFSTVLSYEIGKIRSACSKIVQENGQNYKPTITFIVVQKRHHTRLFLEKPASKLDPGTVVDKTIVTPCLFDFFLCSHSGSNRPSRYFVLHDDNNFTMDQAQLLSYYLCYIYSRCTKSVSYPAPTYYAHLAAFRARNYNRTKLKENINDIVSSEIVVHENMRNKMFYI